VTGFPIAPLVFEGKRYVFYKANSLPANYPEEEFRRPVFTAGISSTSTCTRNNSFPKRLQLFRKLARHQCPASFGFFP
jgi:hypothetical protein